MSQKAFASGQRRGQKPYLNRFSQFFFTELDKGFTSPYVLVVSGTFISYVAWRVTEHYLIPRQAQLNMRQATPKVPMQASHNMFWGLRDTATNVDPSDTRALAASLETSVMESGMSSPMHGGGEAMESAMRRPQLIHTDVSELQERASSANPTGEIDLMCLELPEYDARLGDDVYFRSVHYVPLDGASTAKGGQSEADTTVPAASALNPTERYEENTNYLQFIPGQGKECIHGMAKCKAVTALNNCVPYAGHMEEETARKLMLTLGPVHILRDAAKSFMPVRFTFVKETPVETLVLGLHGGEVPRWLSSAFPNFKVDVVEPDGALVRLCKRFMGFQESNTLSVVVADPVQFVRHTAVHATAEPPKREGSMSLMPSSSTAKRYDLVLVDAVDGAGHLSTQYGRLDFIQNVRNCMSNNGCVAITLPNQDDRLFMNMVHNWRLAFTGKTVLLVHCVTAPYTILMTFQDAAERGRANLGSVANVSEFQDLLRSQLKHYGPNRITFDLVREVNADNFVILDPGRRYDKTQMLPRGHPALRADLASSQPSAASGWNAWVRKLFGGQ